MDLGYTEFQKLLRDTARDFANRDFPITRHRELVESGKTFDEEVWQKMANLQWLGLPINETYGGSGGGWVDLMVLLEEMGGALLPYAFLSHTLAGLIIQEYGSDSQKPALLAAVVGGEKILGVAITEARGTLDEAGIQCSAKADAGGYTLNGTKQFVRGGNVADTLIVLARLDGRLGMFLVERATAGVTTTALGNLGDDDQARVELKNVKVSKEALLGGEAQAWDALTRIVSMGALLECGYGVGMMARDTDMTVNYVKDRVQFGRPLGSFQAVQHQVADQVTDVDCGRYLTLYAAWAMDERLPTAEVEVARAKAWVSDALRRVARTGNQLHGGIGYSREFNLHFYYQRAKTAELMFGIADDHRERVAASLLDG
jgi:alkylation response protein AidB-like acyl-CoA dehydrogenase